MCRTRPARLRWVAAAAAVLLVPSLSSAWGEHHSTFFWGVGGTQSSDLGIRRPTLGTDLKYEDVYWKGDSFGTPPLYGIRYLFYPDLCPHWGFGIDMLHNRALADLGREVRVTGTRNGAPVNAVETLGQSFRRLEFTDGLNSLSFNVVRRWSWTWDECRRLGTIQPYVGAGISLLFPNVETQFVGEPVYKRYEWRGPGFQVFAGVNVPVSNHLGFTLEYRYNYASLTVNILNGTQRSVMNSHSFLFGPTLRF